MKIGNGGSRQVRPSLSSAERVSLEEQLKVLDQKNLIYSVRDPQDPEEHGPDLTAFQALSKLDAGDSVIFKTIGARDFRQGRIPEDRALFYDGSEVKSLVKKHAYKLANRRHAVAECIKIDSGKDLLRAVEAQFSSQDKEARFLTKEEKEMALLLRDLEGGQQGVFQTVLTRDDHGDGYYFETSSGTGSLPGLYSQSDDGFLGLGSKTERLTSYESLERLSEGKPVEIRSAQGSSSTIHSFRDLKTYHRML